MFCFRWKKEKRKFCNSLLTMSWYLLGHRRSTKCFWQPYVHLKIRYTRVPSDVCILHEYHLNIDFFWNNLFSFSCVQPKIKLKIQSRAQSSLDLQLAWMLWVKKKTRLFSNNLKTIFVGNTERFPRPQLHYGIPKGQIEVTPHTQKGNVSVLEFSSVTTIEI